MPTAPRLRFREAVTPPPFAWSLGLHLAFAAFVVLYASSFTAFTARAGVVEAVAMHGCNLVSSIPCPPIQPKPQASSPPNPRASQVAARHSRKERMRSVPDKNTKTKVKPAPPAPLNASRNPNPRVESDSLWRGGPVSGLHHERRSGKGGLDCRHQWRFRQPLPWYVRPWDANHRKLATFDPESPKQSGST